MPTSRIVPPDKCADCRRPRTPRPLPVRAAQRINVLGGDIHGNDDNAGGTRTADGSADRVRVGGGQKNDVCVGGDEMVDLAGLFAKVVFGRHRKNLRLRIDLVSCLRRAADERDEVGDAQRSHRNADGIKRFGWGCLPATLRSSKRTWKIGLSAT